MSKISTRDQILDAGLKVLFRQGYIGAGIRDVVAEAGIPLGSFTNYFRSKESFVGEVLDRYFDNLKKVVGETLDDKSLPPRKRLEKYVDIITARLGADGFQRGCLIGDLSLEASLQSRNLRVRLNEIFQEWRALFAQCIAEAQAAGEIDPKFSPADLAEYFLASWEGAILRMKVEGKPAALERFRRIIFETIFTNKLKKGIK